MELFKLFGTIAISNAEANQAMDESTEKAKSSSNKIGNAFSKLTSVITKVAKVALVTGTAAITKITKDAIGAYGDYEQLVGGVETLFKNSSSKVMEFANKAYKTAGLSANDYMETVTSFSASLLQGLGGDTEKAADIADMAIKDMADNANKMGTSIESIQNAYQGFAKQNYTMLDNLKLGYGGTQSEMIRLINDSGVLNKKIKDLDGISFDTMIQAIHKVQDNMGITGTTAEEAEKTIQGSIASLKASWKNLMVGLADENANLEDLIKTVWENMITVFGNLAPRIKQVFHSLTSLLPGWAQNIVLEIEELAQKIANSIRFVKDNFDIVKTKFNEISSYASEKFEPSLLKIRDALDWIKEKIQPLIDKLIDFKDNTDWLQLSLDLLKTGIDVTSSALENAISFIESAISKMEEAKKWIDDHKTGLELLGVAIGTVTTAIIAYNVANAIANAGGIAHLATLALLRIQFALSTASLTIHTAATWAANAATTALSVAMAFLTSPITLVILAIGALIAIGILLYKNWDTIKEKAGELKDKVVEKVNSMKESISKKFNEIKSNMSNKINEAKTTVLNTFENIKQGISDKIEAAKTAVKNGIDKIKSFFNFSWSLPHLKTPHFSITGSFSLNPPSVPKIGVEWYKNGGILEGIMTEPTVFGFNPKTGAARVGGEAGAEAITPIDRLMDMIRQANNESNSGIITILNSILNLLGLYGPQFVELIKEGKYIVLDDGTLVGATIGRIDEALQERIEYGKRGN